MHQGCSGDIMCSAASFELACPHVECNPHLARMLPQALAAAMEGAPAFRDLAEKVRCAAV